MSYNNDVTASQSLIDNFVTADWNTSYLKSSGEVRNLCLGVYLGRSLKQFFPKAILKEMFSSDAEAGIQKINDAVQTVFTQSNMSDEDKLSLVQNITSTTRALDTKIYGNPRTRIFPNPIVSQQHIQPSPPSILNAIEELEDTSSEGEIGNDTAKKEQQATGSTVAEDLSQVLEQQEQSSILPSTQEVVLNIERVLQKDKEKLLSSLCGDEEVAVIEQTTDSGKEVSTQQQLPSPQKPSRKKRRPNKENSSPEAEKKKKKKKKPAPQHTFLDNKSRSLMNTRGDTSLARLFREEET